jgi:hypothetical protein
MVDVSLMKVTLSASVGWQYACGFDLCRDYQKDSMNEHLKGEI